MRKPEKNLNTSIQNTCDLTPKDATILKTTKSFLLDIKDENIINSFDLMFQGFLMSENAEGTESRSEALYHYNIMKEFLTNLKNLK